MSGRGLAGRVGTLIGSAILFLFGMQLIFLGLLAERKTPWSSSSANSAAAREHS